MDLSEHIGLRAHFLGPRCASDAEGARCAMGMVGARAWAPPLQKGRDGKRTIGLAEWKEEADRLFIAPAALET